MPSEKPTSDSSPPSLMPFDIRAEIRERARERERGSLAARSFPPERRRADAAAVSLAMAAASSSWAIDDPLTRSLVCLGCAVVCYAVGVFQPPPRRQRH